MSELIHRRYWIIVGSPNNFATTASLGFTLQGLKSRHRKKAERMRPGDRLAWYITGAKGFAGVATINSPYWEDHTVIWTSINPKYAGEDYPFRIRISADLVLDPDNYVDVEPIARQMIYARKWPVENWTLAFQGNVHEITAPDFAIIERAVQAHALAAAS